MSENEQKAMHGVIGNVLCNASNFPKAVAVHVLGQNMGPLIDKTVDALIAAGYRRHPEPREVATVEELDALPKWSVVMSDEMAYQSLGRGNWDGLGRGWDSGQIDLPAVILYEPSTEETP